MAELARALEQLEAGKELLEQPGGLGGAKAAFKAGIVAAKAAAKVAKAAADHDGCTAADAAMSDLKAAFRGARETREACDAMRAAAVQRQQQEQQEQQQQ